MGLLLTDDLDSHTQSFVERGMLTELHKNLTHGTHDLQLKVIMVLAELAKSGKYFSMDQKTFGDSLLN